jgi:ribosomal subunit interface protein
VYNEAMNIRVKTTDFEVTSEVSAYLDDKVAALERLISDDAARCEVEIGRAAGHPHQGKIWKAEIILLHYGERLRAVAQEESIKAAIDIAKDEMLQLLRKNKGRSVTRLRHAGAKLKKFARRGDIRSY